MSFTRDTYAGKNTAKNTVRVAGRFQGTGGTGNLTKLASSGITSVNYNSATGNYLITFDYVGENFLGGSVQVMNTAGTTGGQRIVNSSAYSSTNKTLTVFVTDVATPTAQNLASTEEMWIDLVWADTDGPVGG